MPSRSDLMSPHASRNGDNSHATAWTTGVIAMVLLYILSPPPLGWLLDKFGIDAPAWFQFVYAR